MKQTKQQVLNNTILSQSIKENKPNQELHPQENEYETQLLKEHLLGCDKHSLFWVNLLALMTTLCNS